METQWKRLNAVYALITDETNTKLLMVHNLDNGQWTLPGGAVERDESLEEAVIREVNEETGYKVKVHGIVAVNEVKLRKSGEQILFMTFRAEIIGGSPTILHPEEIGEVAWVTLDEADERMPYYKEGLKQIAESGKEVTYFNEGVE